MKQKLNGLQGLRAVAFLAIFISHTLGYACLGAWGVSVFLVLSGFVMVYSYLPRPEITESGVRFMVGKMKKLYPLHIATMLACALYSYFVILTGGDNTVGKLLLDILLHATLLQIWIPNSVYYATLNAVSWYLSVCVLIYVCFPRILRIFKKQNNRKLVFSWMVLLFGVQLVIAAIAGTVYHEGQESAAFVKWLTYFFPPSRLIDFLIGCCLGWLFCHSEQKQEKYALRSIQEILAVFLILLAFVIYTYQLPFLGSYPMKHTALFTISTMFLIWIIAQQKGIVSNILASKIFVDIGNLSQYTFLIHFVAVRYCNGLTNYLHIQPNRYLSAIIVLVITYAATFVWVWAEKRFYTRAKNKKLSLHINE